MIIVYHERLSFVEYRDWFPPQILLRQRPLLQCNCPSKGAIGDSYISTAWFWFLCVIRGRKWMQGKYSHLKLGFEFLYAFELWKICKLNEVGNWDLCWKSKWARILKPSSSRPFCFLPKECEGGYLGHDHVRSTMYFEARRGSICPARLVRNPFLVHKHST